MSFAGFLDFMRKDVDIPNAERELKLGDHAQFIRSFEENKNSYEYIMGEPLRMSGIYWCCAAMDIMGELSKMDREAILQYIRENHQKDGGFSPAQGHDSHLLHTLCAIQLLHIFDGFDDSIDIDAIVRFVEKRQNEDGSFSGDESGEVDTRFSFCALLSLRLLNRLSSSSVRVQSAADFVLRCLNPDGGFGTRPGSESHSGQVYCSVGVLSLAGRLDCIDRDRTASWLAYRQCASGGLNGRPEKLPDVCYSWWVMASLAILGRLHWINKEKIRHFILACQDEEGGFADRPGDYPDPFHTVFGLAGLSLFDSPPGVVPLCCMTPRSLSKVQPPIV